jgi:hypothetical protein
MRSGVSKSAWEGAPGLQNQFMSLETPPKTKPTGTWVCFRFFIQP